MKINIYSSDSKKSTIYINLARVITNKLKPISIPIDLIKSEVIDYEFGIDYEEIAFRSKINPQRLNINFKRTTKFLDLKMYSFFVEYKYLQASQVANRLKYKLMSEDNEGKVKVLHESNELMGKSPLYFSATNFIDKNIFLDFDENRRYLFEFYEGDYYIGQTVLQEIDMMQIISDPEPHIYNVVNEKSIQAEDPKVKTKIKTSKNVFSVNPNSESDKNLLSIKQRSATRTTPRGVTTKIIPSSPRGQPSSPKIYPVGKAIINYRQRIKKRFLDHILEGMDVNFETAIDYTSSNLDPKDPNSLHTLNMSTNKYHKAIESCGNILKIYDTDQLFPLYGFGGVPFQGKEVSHCFNVNGKKDPRVNGIDQVLQLYEQSLSQIELVGPSLFQHLINNMIKEIKNSKNEYHVFLILTDGKIEDMNETKHALVEASKLPMSIIIVGIGKDDFGKMNELDGDVIPISSPITGQVRYRDIVQFVNFADFENDGNQLAAKVLEEIPFQVAEYFDMLPDFNKK